MNDYIDCYKELAMAIIRQAAEDYIAEVNSMFPNPEEIKKLEKFFNSEWFDVLSLDLDKELFMEMLKKKAKNKRA